MSEYVVVTGKPTFFPVNHPVWEASKRPDFDWDHWQAHHQIRFLDGRPRLSLVADADEEADA